jgi:hypothetical protein
MRQLRNLLCAPADAQHVNPEGRKGRVRKSSCRKKALLGSREGQRHGIAFEADDTVGRGGERTGSDLPPPSWEIRKAHRYGEPRGRRVESSAGCSALPFDPIYQILGFFSSPFISHFSFG